MKHRHYSPRAKVKLVNGSVHFDVGERDGYIGLEKPDANFAHVLVCSSVDDFARSVFAFFRECDERQIETIYCEIVPETGIGAALMDRLRRAAE